MASAQSAWSYQLLSGPVVTTNRRSVTPARSTATAVGPSAPVFTDDWNKRRDVPSHTSNTTDPFEPTSSSTPTWADNEQSAGIAYRNSLSACTPKPFANTVPPIRIGTPSPAAASPFERSRSYGPHPFTGVADGVRSDKYDTDEPPEPVDRIRRSSPALMAR